MADVLILVASESDKPRTSRRSRSSRRRFSYEFYARPRIASRSRPASWSRRRKKGFKSSSPGRAVGRASGFAASLTDLPVIGVPFASGRQWARCAARDGGRCRQVSRSPTVGIDNAKTRRTWRSAFSGLT